MYTHRHLFSWKIAIRPCEHRTDFDGFSLIPFTARTSTDCQVTDKKGAYICHVTDKKQGLFLSRY